MYCALLWASLHDFISLTESILPSTWVTHSILIDDSFKPEPPHFTWHYCFHLEWPVPLLHVSPTWGLVITQSCSISKTLNSNISFFLLNPWPLCYLSDHQYFLCYLLCQISLVSMVQRLNLSCVIFWMSLSLLLLLLLLLLSRFSRVRLCATP